MVVAGVADFWRRRKLLIIVGVAFICLVAVFVHVRVQPLKRRSSEKGRITPKPPTRTFQFNKGTGKKKNKNKMFAPPPFVLNKMKNKPKGFGQGWPSPNKPGGWGKPPVPGKGWVGPDKKPDKPAGSVDGWGKPQGPDIGKDTDVAKPKDAGQPEGGKKVVDNVDQWNKPKKSGDKEMDDSKELDELEIRKKIDALGRSVTSKPPDAGSGDKNKTSVVGTKKGKGRGRKKIDMLGEAEEEHGKKLGKALADLKEEKVDDDEDLLPQGRGRDKAGKGIQDGRGLVPGSSQRNGQAGRRRGQDGRLLGQGGNRQQQQQVQQGQADRWRRPGPESQQGQQRQPGQINRGNTWKQGQGQVGQQGQGQLGQQGQGQLGQQGQGQLGQQGRGQMGQQGQGQVGQQGRGQVGQQDIWGQQVRGQQGQQGRGLQRGQWGQQLQNQQGQQGQQVRNPQGQQQNQWNQQGRQNRPAQWNGQGPNQVRDGPMPGRKDTGNSLRPKIPGMGGGLSRRDAEDEDSGARYRRLQANNGPSSGAAGAYVHTRTPIGTPPSLKHTVRQEAVVKAFLHSWKAYSKYAWGMDEYNPLTHTGASSFFGQGLTIVDSLDTIWMMGLREEYQRARAWVTENLDIDHNVNKVSTFETTIRVLGGMLSMYHLTGDRLYLEKATKVGARLLPAFETLSDIPASAVNLASGTHDLGTTTVAEAGTLQLEFRDLSRATGNTTFKTACDNAMDQILSASEGRMVSMTIDVRTGRFGGGVYTAGAGVDSYYEYLLKQWLQSGKRETKFREAYMKSTREVLSNLVGTTKPHNMAYLGMKASRSAERVATSMDHLSCFYPGMLALGIMNGLLPESQAMARNLTHTCYYMYNITLPTHLAPEIFRFNNLPSKENDVLRSSDPQNMQRPETVESLFYLYRLTKNEQYRDWAWKIFEAFRNSTKLQEGGYTSLSSVYLPKQYKNRMESFFLAETLKYLFLLFGDDDTFLSLDEWVFNTEAHPLPIWKVT